MTYIFEFLGEFFVFWLCDSDVSSAFYFDKLFSEPDFLLNSDSFYIFWGKFSFCLLFAGFIIGLLTFLALKLFLKIVDKSLDKLIEYIARKREIKNGTAGKRKEEKDG